MNLADAKYVDCACCGPKGVARGEVGALCPLCEDAKCEPFENVCKVDKREAVHAAAQGQVGGSSSLGQVGGLTGDMEKGSR